MARFTYDYYKSMYGYEVRRTDENGIHSYLKSYYNGDYVWTHDYLYAKAFAESTAEKHVSKLNASSGTRTKILYVPQFYSVNPWTENTWCGYFNDTTYDTLEKAQRHLENYAAAHPIQRIIKRTILEEVIL